MSTYNICFCGEIRKILYSYFSLSGAMAMGKRGGQINSSLFFYENMFWDLVEVLLMSTHNVCCHLEISTFFFFG